MTRYRLEPSHAQEEILLRHCSDARYVWNLCVEQESWWRRDRGKMPGWAERCRQLTEARADNPWLESQAVFLCTACKFACNADVNAARNIAAGHAVKARRGDGTSRPLTREPQLALLSA